MGEPGLHRASGGALLAWPAAAGLVAVLAAAASGESGSLVAQAAAEAAAAAACVTAARRGRGWAAWSWGLMAAGIGMWALADGVAGLIGTDVFDVSVLDAVWFGAYVPLSASVGLAYWNLRPSRDVLAGLDAVVLALMAAALVWGLALHPGASGGDVADHALLLVYPTLDLALAGLAGWLAATRRTLRSPLALLFAGFAGRALGGVLFLVGDVAGVEWWAWAAGVVYAVAASLIGVAAVPRARWGPLIPATGHAGRTAPWVTVVSTLALAAAILVALGMHDLWAGVVLAVALVLVGLRGWIAARGARVAEAALAEDEERQRIAVEGLAEGVVMRYADGTIGAVNPAAQRMLGIGPGAVVPDGRYPGVRVLREDGSILPPGDHPALLALRTGETVRALVQIARQGGERRLVRVTSTPLRRPGERAPYAVVSGLLDVTEERAMQQRLAESEERHRRLNEQMSDVVYRYRLTPDPGFEYVSPSVTGLIGYTPEDHYADPGLALAVIHPDDRPALAARLAAGRENQGEPTVLRWIHRDGRVVWVEQRSTVEEDDAAGRWIQGVARDVTGRVRAERALRESEERLALALEANRDGLWDWDIPSGRVHFSEGWYEMLGYHRGDLEEHVSAWERLVHPDDIAGVMETLAEHIDGRSDVYSCEHRLRSASGEWRWVLDRGRVVERGATGAPLRAVGTHTDVTERRTAAEAVRRERDRTAAVLAAMGDGVVVLSPEGEFLEVNGAFCAMVGSTPERLIGRRPPYAAWPGDEMAHLRPVLEALRAGRDGDLDASLPRPGGGGRVPVRLTLSHLRDDDGAITAHVVSVKDMTDVRLRQAEEAALRRVATLVAGGADAGDVFSLVSREAVDLLEATAASVIRFSADPAPVLGLAVRGAAASVPAEDGLVLDLSGPTATARVFREGRPARAGYELAPDDSLMRLGHAGNWGLAAPIRVDGRLWGAVAVLRPRAEYPDFPGDALDRLARFGEMVALAIGTTAARQELVDQATVDPLTRLANHRVFHERLAAEVGRAQRHERPLALAVLDLDHFKRVNDTRGHQAGDAVLREMGRLLGSQARDHDTVARVGGEELAWILPEAWLHEGVQAAERLRRVVAEEPIAGAGSITVSVGVAELEPGEPPEALYRRADAALYWAKGHGRDQVVGYTAELATHIADRDQAERSVRLSPTDRALRALSWAVDARDPMARRHSERTAALTVALATALGWSPERAALLGQAGLVHDVGMIGIPDAVLFSPGGLDVAGRRAVEQHARLGAEIVATTLSEEQASWVLHHHEHWDGTGYPDGLAGEGIPEGARIVGLAAAWDTMTTSSTYRDALTDQEALAECRRCAGSQFWPPAVSALARLVQAHAVPDPAVVAPALPARGGAG